MNDPQQIFKKNLTFGEIIIRIIFSISERYLIKTTACNVIERETPVRVFSCEFIEILQQM